MIAPLKEEKKEDESYFPITIEIYPVGEIKICNSPEDVPKYVAFRVVGTNKWAVIA